ncbi:MAG TPA: HTH domain-containing protein [Polyangiaceae bacterium]
MKRTERLFAIAEYLRGRRTGATAEAIAERFGVTVRTAYRDLASLRDADLPLVAERGRGGGYALDKSYALPPVNFNAREAAVLISAGQFLAEMRIIPFAATLASAIDKVRAALDRSAQRELQNRLHELAYVGVPARPTREDVRRALEQAWFERRVLEIRYRGANEITTTRRIRLERIVMDRAEIRLNALDLDKNEKRQFALDRVEHAAVIET